MTDETRYTIPTTERIRVRYGETDMMGHAYYANYFYWFEQARGAWCRERGFAYRQMEEAGYKIPVVECHAQYRAEVLYDDLIEVRVWISDVKRASIRFDYEVYNVTRDRMSTTGYTIHVMVGEEKRAVTIPDFLKEWLNRDPRTTAPFTE
jgi:acyl-CoA thioester hydrolase